MKATYVSKISILEQNLNPIASNIK